MLPVENFWEETNNTPKGGGNNTSNMQCMRQGHMSTNVALPPREGL